MIVAPPEQKSNISNMGKGHEIRLADTEAGRRVLIELYIDKVYTDKVWAVVREYTTNAMDANIAAGRGDLPIEITLPYYERGSWGNNCASKKSNLFRIRDFGEGLDENEIVQIFIVLGESTKRLDNAQTGNMGIGAKSGFAYGEFTVTSIKDGKKWHYLAKRNNSNAPTLIPIGIPQDTTEHSGLIIEFQVKDEDINQFRSRSFFIGQFAKVRPKFINDFGHKFDEHKPVISGDGWKVIPRTNSNYIEEFNVVMANICYVCRDRDLLNKLNSIIFTSQYGLVVNVGPGEVSIPPSREELEYTELTRRTLTKHIKSLEDSIQKQVDADIASATNVFEAFAKYQTINSFFRINKFTWNGKIYTSSSYLENICYSILARKGKKITASKHTNFVDDKGNKIPLNSASIAHNLINKSVKVVSNLNIDDTRTNRWKLNTISGFSGYDTLVCIDSIPAEYGSVASELDWSTVAITKPPKTESARHAYSSVYEFNAKDQSWEQLENDEIPDGEKVFVILSSNMGVSALNIRMYDIAQEVNGAFPIYGIRSSKLEKVYNKDEGWTLFQDKIAALGTFKHEIHEAPYRPKYFNGFRTVFNKIKAAKSYHKLIKDVESSTLNSDCPQVLSVVVDVTNKKNDWIKVEPTRIPSKLDTKTQFEALEKQFPWMARVLTDCYVSYENVSDYAKIFEQDAALKNITFS